MKYGYIKMKVNYDISIINEFIVFKNNCSFTIYEYNGAFETHME